MTERLKLLLVVFYNTKSLRRWFWLDGTHSLQTLGQVAGPVFIMSHYVIMDKKPLIVHLDGPERSNSARPSACQVTAPFYRDPSTTCSSVHSLTASLQSAGVKYSVIILDITSICVYNITYGQELSTVSPHPSHLQPTITLNYSKRLRRSSALGQPTDSHLFPETEPKLNRPLTVHQLGTCRVRDHLLGSLDAQEDPDTSDPSESFGCASVPEM